MEKIAVIGLGYVGLPLAVEFGKILPVVGFDINSERIKELRVRQDRTKEVDEAELSKAVHLIITAGTHKASSVKVAEAAKVI